jgi:RNA polymerase sigma-70 factor (ECF subfamily)
MDEPEEKLVLLAQAGDQEAFDTLLRRYEKPLFRHIHRMLGDEDACYEALQETYLAIVRSIRKLRSRRSFRPWAYGVATRTCLKARSRRSSSRMELDASLDPPDLKPLPDSLASAREELEGLVEEVLLLSPRLRSVILLHFFEGLTLKEVASALEISIGTVKSRLAAGLAHLRLARQGGVS